MSRLFFRLKTHFTNWREWEFNPVVVKELRQAVRSWAVTGTLLLFLFVLFCAAVIFFVTQSFQESQNQRLGADIFMTFSVILTGASMLFIPLYVGVRLAAERQDSNLDLLYISTLTPQRIIRGKFFCGAYVAVLFFSACMPFMAFTNLLRGVDLPSIFFILLCLFLAVCCAVQISIFFACLPLSKLFKISVGLITLIASVWMTAMLSVWTFEMMRRGVGSMMSDRTFWGLFLTVCSLIFVGVLFLYYLSVALISPPSANRALPVRVYMSVVWILGAVLSVAWTLQRHDARLMLPWAIVSFIVFGVSLAVIVSNNDQLSYRVRRSIPESLSKRAVAFLFYNGAAGGLLWLAFQIGFTYAVMLAFQTFWGGAMLPKEEAHSFFVNSASAMFYAFAYALAALFIHRKFCSRRPAKLAGVLAILLPGVWAVLPTIFLFFVNHLSVNTLERVQLGNLFNVFFLKEDGQRWAHFTCAVLLFVLALIFNAKWFVRQVREFQPLRRSAKPPIITEAPPVVPATVA